MTQPNGGPNSARGFISAAARSKRVKEAAQKDKRTARANLTPWQQALLYENRANPYPFYAELRKTPVSQQPDGSYVVSTYREIVSILHDPRVSSDPRKRANGLSAAEAACDNAALRPTPFNRIGVQPGGRDQAHCRRLTRQTER